MGHSCILIILHWNTKASRDVCMVWFTTHLDECTLVVSVLLTTWLSSFLLLGGLMCSITLRISPIVWCSLSIIAFSCVFFTVVGTL